MKTKCNLHTHSTFCDGKHTPEENVKQAILLGLHTIGFSSHAPYGAHCTEGCLNDETVEKYRDEIIWLMQDYVDDIGVVLGIEQDIFSPSIDVMSYDYVIGSVHYVKKEGEYVPIDYSPEKLGEGLKKCFGGDAYALAKEYYRTVADVVKITDCDIIGHFDILTKFNEKYPFIDENDRAYRNMALEATDALLESGRIFEVNTGAMSRGWRKHPYPADFILKRIISKGGRLMVTSDAHDKSMLISGFDETETYLRELGAREIWTFKYDEFLPLEL